MMLTKGIDLWNTTVVYSVFFNGKFVEKKETKLYDHYLSIKNFNPLTLKKMFDYFTRNGWKYVLHSDEVNMRDVVHYMHEGEHLFFQHQFDRLTKKKKGVE